ncbi:MAG: hypothetical protein ACOX68_05105 [Candidatus Limivicinus sp.]|jgi:hypothetical protein
MEANLIGQTVKHAYFGKGTVADIDGNIVEIQFSEEKKRFLYPDAFSKFLTLKDNKMQNEVNRVYNNRLKKETAAREERNKEQRKMHKLRTMKIGKKAQAVFNIPFFNAPSIYEKGEIFTGCYLSGYSKGEPRIPNRIKPNSACLLTALPEGKGEEAREILGVFMVKDNFWGEYCRDGIVKAHEKYNLLLPEDKHLLFWKYFGISKPDTKWGNVPFKYFENETMQKILVDIVEALADTDQEDEAKGFYHYFSSINRLPLKMYKPGEKKAELKAAAQ